MEISDQVFICVTATVQHETKRNSAPQFDQLRFTRGKECMCVCVCVCMYTHYFICFKNIYIINIFTCVVHIFMYV